METIAVYSPIEDTNIQKNLDSSPIWKNAIHQTDLDELEKNYPKLFKYKIKFDGLKPIQVTKISVYKESV